jgi:hypothetical protein
VRIKTPDHAECASTAISGMGPTNESNWSLRSCVRGRDNITAALAPGAGGTMVIRCEGVRGDYSRAITGRV